MCSCKKLSVEFFMPLFMLYYDRVENARECKRICHDILNNSILQHVFHCVVIVCVNLYKPWFLLGPCALDRFFNPYWNTWHIIGIHWKCPEWWSTEMKQVLDWSFRAVKIIQIKLLFNPAQKQEWQGWYEIQTLRTLMSVFNLVVSELPFLSTMFSLLLFCRLDSDLW